MGGWGHRTAVTEGGRMECGPCNLAPFRLRFCYTLMLKQPRPGDIPEVGSHDINTINHLQTPDTFFWKLFPVPLFMYTHTYGVSSSFVPTLSLPFHFVPTAMIQTPTPYHSSSPSPQSSPSRWARARTRYRTAPTRTPTTEHRHRYKHRLHRRGDRPRVNNTVGTVVCAVVSVSTVVERSIPVVAALVASVRPTAKMAVMVTVAVLLTTDVVRVTYLDFYRAVM